MEERLLDDVEVDFLECASLASISTPVTTENIEQTGSHLFCLSNSYGYSFFGNQKTLYFGTTENLCSTEAQIESISLERICGDEPFHILSLSSDETLLAVVVNEYIYFFEIKEIVSKRATVLSKLQLNSEVKQFQWNPKKPSQYLALNSNGEVFFGDWSSVSPKKLDQNVYSSKPFIFIIFFFFFIFCPVSWDFSGTKVIYGHQNCTVSIRNLESTSPPPQIIPKEFQECTEGRLFSIHKSLLTIMK